MIEIEVLFFEGCPNGPPTLALVKQVLKEKSVAATIRTTLVADDKAAFLNRFHGSPSVRVNGVDLESDREDQTPFYGCRLYREGGKSSGIPSRELIENALNRK